MKHRHHLLFTLPLCSFLLGIAPANARPDVAVAPAGFGKQVSATGIKHSFLVTGGRTIIVSEDNQIVWDAKTNSRDGYVLENGNILVTHAKAAKEYKRDGSVVWEYKLSKENGEMSTAIRLVNGDTMVTELGRKPRILEVGKDGKIKKEIPLKPDTNNVHMQTRMARKLANGNYLVPHLLGFAVKEYDPSGKVVNTIKTDLEELGGRKAENWPFTAIRLKDGRTQVNLTHGNKVVVFDKDGKVDWKVDNKDIGPLIDDACGGQRLPNGNVVICSYHQKKADKPKLLEVNADKKVVWEYFNPKFSGGHEIHILTTNGKPVKPVMR